MIEKIANQTIGVLGGGQLGRMLIQAAINFDCHIHCLDPSPHAPCRDIATQFKVGSLHDSAAILEFAKDCDVVTIEIENVDVSALYELERLGTKVFPQAAVIELIQDKRRQKQFYADHDIPTAAFAIVESKQEFAKHSELFPAYHKLALAGYDGQGVQRIADASEFAKGFTAPGVLEKAIDYTHEIAVIVARNQRGETVHYPLTQCVFHPEANLVEYLQSPVELEQAIQDKAIAIAYQVIEKLDMVGLLAVEMFVCADGSVLVNEIAPRPHNSGHHTIEANITSQFEQHLRAIMNLPLGATDNLSNAVMINILGEPEHSGPVLYHGLPEVLAIPGAHIHLYGKQSTKPFRKMGHVTVTGDDMVLVKQRAKQIKDKLKVIA